MSSSASGVKLALCALCFFVGGVTSFPFDEALTGDEIANVRSIFNKNVETNENKLGKDGLREAFASLGVELSDNDLSKILDAMVGDKNGKITQPQFEDLAFQDKTFRKVDVDENGIITVDELQKAFESVDEENRPSHEQIKSMVKKAGDDKGNISFADFVVYNQKEDEE